MPSTIETMVMSNGDHHKRKRMWLSSETSSSIYDLANWTLIAALAVGAVSTGLVVWTGKAKEAYSRLEVARLGKEAADARLETQRIKTQLASRRITKMSTRVGKGAEPNQRPHPYRALTRRP